MPAHRHESSFTPVSAVISFEIRIRNTSRVPLDFDPEEITKRFVRGEKARTGEGSGLGLAIAKTYTESCGGQFHIAIEDDCFIAVICLPSITS